MQAFPTSLLIEKPLILASLYELTTIVFGSEAIARLSTGDDKDEFDTLRVRHEIAQASKLLIENAVIIRNLLDGETWPMDVIHEHRVNKRPETAVGALSEGRNPPVDLSFREACNKLIHAKHISFGMTKLPEPEKMDYLNGAVELHGTKGKEQWVATIQVADFVRMAVRQL